MRSPWAALAAVASAAVAVVALLGEHAAVLVHRCVAVDGLGAWLGVRLALLRAGECPEGSLAIGGDGQQLLTLVVGAAVPVLLAHLLGAALGLGLAARLRRLVRHVLRLVRLPEPAPRPLVPTTRPVVGPTPRLRTWPGGRTVTLRGPPVPVVA